MRKWLQICFMGLLFLSLTACQTNKPSEDSDSGTTAVVGTEQTEKPDTTVENITLRIGFSTSASDPRVQAAETFEKQVEKQTDGRIQVELYPDGKLGSDAELIQGVVQGNVDITVSSAGNFANYVTKMGASAFPFLFSDFKDAWEFMDSEEERKIEEELLDYNIKVLAHFDNGFRCVTTSKEAGPVKTVKDMKGLKIRTPDNQIVKETLSALGANPHVLDFTKLYDALKNNEFDAQENPVPIIYNQKLYEVQSYLAITNHSYDAMPFVIRADIWEKLDAQDQEVMESAALEAQKQNREMIQAQTEEYVRKLQDKGMKVTYPDLAKFKKATTGVYDYFASSYGEKLMEMLKQRK